MPGNDLMAHRASVGSFQSSWYKTLHTKTVVKQHLGIPPSTIILISIWLSVVINCISYEPSDKGKSRILKSLQILGYAWSLSVVLLSLSGDVETNPGPVTNSRPTLDCILLNAQSLKTVDREVNKIQDL